MPKSGKVTPSPSLSLSGPITLYETAEIRETLRAALSEKQDLLIDLDASGPWDLAGLQLLVSLVNTGLKQGISVRFVRVPGVCREVAERSGIGDWLASLTDSLG